MDCCIINCEYNAEGRCLYCGDYWNLNDPNCMSFEEEYVPIKEVNDEDS